MTDSPSQLSYKDAGVDIAAADSFVAGIKALAKSTHTDQVVSARSQYAGLVRVPTEGMSQPVLAATCDGVGTKLLVARDYGYYRGLGQDLVAMSVNDLLPLGAKPLLFLDYIATGKLEPKALTDVVAGVADACRQSGCALLGGETAEMPGVYPAGEFDLAGFAVGIVDESRIPTKESTDADPAVGDVVFALPSSGVHSNGFSLVRKALLEKAGYTLQDKPDALGGATLGETLLRPTELYVKPVLDLMQNVPVKCAAHITGGGLAGRVGKLAVQNVRLKLDPKAWTVPPIFDLISEAGNITPQEMADTFNLGLGYVIVVSAEHASAIAKDGGPWLRVGEVVEGAAGMEWGDVTG